MPQRRQKIVNGIAQAFYLFLIDLAVAYDCHSVALEQPACAAALHGNDRADYLERHEQKHRDDGIEQRDIRILHRYSRDFGEQNSYNKFRRLKLAYLPFSHYSDRRSRQNI